MALFIRIALRWIAGALIAAGYLTAEDRTLFGDPALVAVVTSIVGLVCGLVAELWYWAARKLGWQT